MFDLLTVTYIHHVSCVAAIVLNAGNEVLLIQRDEKPDLEFAGDWTLPGGLVEANETPDDAIKRELAEETELSTELKRWKTYARLHHQLIDGRIVVVDQHVYVGRLTGLASIRLHEGQAYGFFSRDSLHRLRLAYGFDRLLSEFIT